MLIIFSATKDMAVADIKYCPIFLTRSNKFRVSRPLLIRFAIDRIVNDGNRKSVSISRDYHGDRNERRPCVAKLRSNITVFFL